MTLKDLQMRQLAQITHIDAKPEIRNRLTSLGLTNGAIIKLIRKSIAGQTIAVQINASVVALRKEEAAHISVTPLS